MWEIASLKLFIAYVLTLLQVRAWFQKELPSSRLNKTPPIGAPKAAASYKIKNMQHVKFTVLKNTYNSDFVTNSYGESWDSSCENHESRSV